MIEVWYGCKVSVKNLKNCAFYHENECEFFLVNCFICDQNLWVKFGWDINCDICGTQLEWDEKERQAEVIKIICGRITEVQNQ